MSEPVRSTRGRDRQGHRRLLRAAHQRRVLCFLKLVAKAHPRRQLHVVWDNYATHKHPNVVAWLKKNPRVTLHFTPTSGSWLNMVEIFFGIITRQAIRRSNSQDLVCHERWRCGV